MKIVVASCDKNIDLFDAYHHCMEKYWPDHPEIIYLQETIQNPYYKTICKDYPKEIWTRRIRESLQEIDDDIILFTTDDDFLNDYVNTQKLEHLPPYLKGNTASINLELSFSQEDLVCEYQGLKYRPPYGPVPISLQCGLWQREKLIHVLDRDAGIWTVEEEPDLKGYDFYILNNSKVLSWTGDAPHHRGGLAYGKWHRYTRTFLEDEGIYMDYDSRGYCD